MVPHHPSRRSVLQTVGTGIGIAALGTAWASGAVGADELDPRVEWVRSYRGIEREFEYEPRVVGRTADGGYVLGGEGAPIGETGSERGQFGCLKVDGTGDREWISFGLDGHAAEFVTPTDVIEQRVGDYTLVGTGEYDEGSEPDRWREPVARAATFAANGELAWTAVFGAFAKDHEETIPVQASPRFAALTQAHQGGGAVAVGSLGMDGWAVSFASDGTIEWQRTFENATRIADAHTTDGGYRLHAVRGNENVVLHVDPTGAVEREVVLDIDYAAIPHNHVVVPTSYGGYAVTGRYDGRQRMVLQTFDGSGAAQWLETYNGEYDGYDWAYDVVQTADEGFLLFGRMDAAYTGDTVPAVVKTDATGNEEWRTILESHAGVSYRVGMTTDDGFASFIPGANNALVKYGTGSTVGVSGSDEVGSDNSGETTDGDNVDSDDTGANPDTEEDGSPTDDTDDNESATIREDDARGSGESDDAGATANDDAESRESDSNDTATTDEQPTTVTDDDVPGFGLVAALGGFGGAIAWSLGGRHSPPDEGDVGST